jgi:hypothetical protein
VAAPVTIVEIGEEEFQDDAPSQSKRTLSPDKGWMDNMNAAVMALACLAVQRLA